MVTSILLLKAQMDSEGYTENLVCLTKDLIKGFQEIQVHAENGQLNLVLEQNWDDNIKVEFARVYQKWAEFTQLFVNRF